MAPFLREETNNTIAIMQVQTLLRGRPSPLVLGVILAAVFALIAGCGYSGSATVAPVVALQGSVHGGRQPVSGSTIQLYAAGTSGNGSAATPLLSKEIKSDASGNFAVPAGYFCPSASSQVFIVARGGSPGLASGVDNPALNLTAMLGPCSNLASVGSISINEVTTVGSVWPLAQYMKSSTSLGAAAADPSFIAAVSTVPEFINIAQGTSPGTPKPNSYFAQSTKLFSLADLLAACVNSAGGTAGDGGPCGRLFTMATPSNGSVPSDTMTAAMLIAQNPANNVNGIFGLVSADTPFQPLLTSAPADWSLSLSYPVATPSISLATGTYSGTQQVTISDSTAGSTIYYTTDGTVPTTASSLYQGALLISVSSTIQAAAFLQGSESAVAESAITIAQAAPPAMLAFLQQPTDALAGATLAPAVQVVVEDGNGNVVVGATNPVTLALAGGSGLSGTLTAVPQNGIATFSDLSVSAPGRYSVLATSPNLGSASSATFTITAAVGGAGPVPTKMVFLQQPSNALTFAPISPAVQVALEDSNGNTVTSATNAVTLVLVSGAGIGGTLWTAIPQNGIATFSGLAIGTVGTGYTFSASSPSLASVVSSAFSITAPTGQTSPTPAKLAFLQQPSNALTGATISPAVQVVVEDSNGNAVTTATNPVTLALAGGTGLGGTLTITPQNGVATFGNLSVSNAGSNYTLSASSPSLSPASSNIFVINAPASGYPPSPVKLAFLQQPSNALTGATISPAITVVVEDANGTAVSNATNTVTLTLSGGTSLGGTLTASALNGIATFNNLSISTAGAGYTLAASSPTLASATSTNFTITAPSSSGPTPAKLAFLRQPSNALTGATLPPVQVVIEDSNGNAVGGAVNPVTLALSGGTGLTGTLTVNAQNGIATFNNLSVGNAGSYSLTAASPALASASSASFTISSPVTPAKLAFLQQPSNALTGAIIAPAIQVVVEDSSGNAVTNATNPVTLALSSGTGLGGTLTTVAVNGIATFSNLSASNAGTFTLSAASSGLTSATSNSFTTTQAGGGAPTAVKLAFMQEPTSAVAGSTISPAVTVRIEDANGNIVASATNAVSLSLTAGAGLGGTLTMNAQNGVATFSNLTESTAGNYTLSATSTGLTTALSSSFTISAAAPTAAKLAFMQEPTSAVAGATISPAVTVRLEDANGNTVTSASNAVSLSLTAGSGLGGTLTVNPQNGVATFGNLTESVAGTYTLSATSTGLTTALSSSFTISAAGGAPTAVKLAFLQQPTNAVAGATISPAVTVLLEDANGATVTSANAPVTLSLTSGSGLGGTLTANAQNGVATFGNLTESVAGTYSLSATSTGLTTALSSSFIISAAGGAPTAVKLAFLQQPTNVVAGATISPAVTVLLEDANGATVTSATAPVTLSLTSGSGLGGALTANAQNGVATFGNLTESVAGTYSLSATSPALTAATSSSFTISAPGGGAPTPVKLVFLQQPSDALTGATITPAVSVLVEDSSGNTVAGATNPVTIAITTGSGLGGTLTVTPQNGVAAFSNLTESIAGTYSLSARSAALISATSAPFTITVPVVVPTPVKLAFVQQPSNATTGATISPAVTVAVEDALGNTVTTATNQVTLGLTSGSGLGGALTATAVNGLATFRTLTVSNPGSYTLSATSTGLIPAISALFAITSQVSTGATYYLSPNGNDSNSGLSAASPWLSPNHSVNCGDTIVAVPGTYSAANFNTGRWGVVSCPAGNSVAWLQCATFDACKISTTTNQGMWVDESYWGVSGWEITVSSYQDGACFTASPRISNQVTIHHIIFANNVANGCMGGGFTAYSRSRSASVDYIAYVGNIAYNAAQGNGACFSGFNIYQPIASDHSAGTHMYVSGNFSYGNYDPATCGGGASTDGEGIIIDTLDFSQGGGTPYTQQVVVDNNIVVGNGSFGIEVFNNQAGSTHAPIYFRHITAWGNLRDNNQRKLGAGEITVNAAKDIQVTQSLAQTVSSTGFGGNPIWALAMENGDATNTMNDNFGAGLGGNNAFLYNGGSFAYGANNFMGIDPGFSHPVVPGAPSCGGTANVQSCMASVVADFTPRSALAIGLGYQAPGSAPVNDPLFPRWLCTANVPTGLITMGCN